eukprot:358192-Chlamydomonas_euryale.AAC.10
MHACATRTRACAARFAARERDGMCRRHLTDSGSPLCGAREPRMRGAEAPSRNRSMAKDSRVANPRPGLRSLPSPAALGEGSAKATSGSFCLCAPGYLSHANPCERDVSARPIFLLSTINEELRTARCGQLSHLQEVPAEHGLRRRSIQLPAPPPAVLPGRHKLQTCCRAPMKHGRSSVVPRSCGGRSPPASASPRRCQWPRCAPRANVWRGAAPSLEPS